MQGEAFRGHDGSSTSLKLSSWSSCCTIEQGVPDWLLDLAAVDFSLLCNRKENRYCTFCHINFCGWRCPSEHLHHEPDDSGLYFGSIHVQLGHDKCKLVKESEISRLIKCSDVQTSYVDSEDQRWVLLGPLSEHSEQCGSIVDSNKRGWQKERCSIKCTFQEKQPLNDVKRFILTYLLVKDFDHRPCGFCINCRLPICSSGDHQDHQTLSVVHMRGRYFLSIPAEAEGLIPNLNFCQLYDNEVPGSRLLPLTVPLPPKRCLCGSPVARDDAWFCTLACMVRHT